MKVGDPKQAAILSIVAFCSVAFLGYQLFPKGTLNSAVANLLASKASDPVPTANGVLTRDAFSHPSLAKAKMNDVSSTATESMQHRSTSEQTVSLPSLPGTLNTTIEPIDSGSKPAENTGNNQQHEMKQTVKVKLVGVMTSLHPVAFLNVGSGGTKEFRIGDQVASGLNVKRIEEERVLLSQRGSTLVLTVGKEVDL